MAWFIPHVLMIVVLMLASIVSSFMETEILPHIPMTSLFLGAFQCWIVKEFHWDLLKCKETNDASSSSQYTIQNDVV